MLAAQLKHSKIFCVIMVLLYSMSVTGAFLLVHFICILARLIIFSHDICAQMAHGGTNFGFYNGANTGQNEFEYKADLTYDYASVFRHKTSHFLNYFFMCTYFM